MVLEIILTFIYSRLQSKNYIFIRIDNSSQFNPSFLRLGLKNKVSTS